MKRKFSKLALAAILCTAFVFVYSAGALAAVVLNSDGPNSIPTVTLTATSANATFGFNRADTNLFDSFEDVMPGDTLTQNVRVQTAAGNPNRYRIYLYARPSAEAGQTEGFLEAMQLAVMKNGVRLPVEQANAGTQGVLLGAFDANQSEDLTVQLTVPIEMGNEFQGANGLVDWMFYAEQETGDTPPPNPDPNPNPNPNPNPTPDTPSGGGGSRRPIPTPNTPMPVVTVPDTDVPLGELDLTDPVTGDEEIIVEDTEIPLALPEIDIDEEAVPLSGIPKTGDSSPLLLMIILMIGSGTALTALICFGKRPVKK